MKRIGLAEAAFENQLDPGKGLWLEHGTSARGNKVVYAPRLLMKATRERVLASISPSKRAETPLPERWHVEGLRQWLDDEMRVQNLVYATVLFARVYKVLRLTIHDAQPPFAGRVVPSRSFNASPPKGVRICFRRALAAANRVNNKNKTKARDADEEAAKMEQQEISAKRLLEKLSAEQSDEHIRTVHVAYALVGF